MQSESEWDEITEEANYGREQVEFQTQMRVGQRQARVTEREKEKVNWGQKKNKGERRESLGRQIWGRRRGRLVSIGFEMPWCRCTPAPGFDKSEIEKGGIQGKDKERKTERREGKQEGEGAREREAKKEKKQEKEKEGEKERGREEERARERKRAPTTVTRTMQAPLIPPPRAAPPPPRPPADE